MSNTEFITEARKLANGEDHPGDMWFIETVLFLCDALEQAESQPTITHEERKAWQHACESRDRLRQEIVKVEQERDALKARVAELEGE